MAGTTSTCTPSGVVFSEKKQMDTANSKKSYGSVTWKSMSIRQKCSYLASNITVEPMMACYVIPCVLGSLATQNLSLEKACRVNLAYPDPVCSALASRNTTGYEAEELAVQQLVARMQTWKSALQSAIPLVLILFIGAWSDRTGLRKPCMLLPIIGEFLTSVAQLVSTYFFYELPMEVLGFSEAIFPAITGGWFTMFLGVFSYLADITTVESRTLRIGAANVFLSLGIPIGMSLSGILYLKIGFYGVFGISTVSFALVFIYGLVVIKEAPRTNLQKAVRLQEKKMSPCAWIIDFFSLRHVEETFRVAFRKGENNRRKRVIMLMVVLMVVIGPLYGEMAVMYLYMRYRYNWNAVKFSMFSTFAMVTNLIGTAISVGLFSHILKIDDAIVGIVSCMSKILAGFVYAFASTDWMIYLAAIIEIVNGTSLIAMRSMASKLVPSDELGKVNSLFGVCESLMPVFYGPMYSFIYAQTMDIFPGTFFVIGGLMTMPAIFAFVWLYMENRRDRQREEKMKAVTKSDALEGSDVKPVKLQTITEKQPDTAPMCGVDNSGFVSEHL